MEAKMPTKTKIEWADYVTNPIRAFVSDNPNKDGYACVRKSEGCAHCWASTFNMRLGTGLEYTLPNLHRVTVYLKHKELLAIRTFKPHGPFKNGRSRAMVFPCDMTDLFGEWMDKFSIRLVFDALAYRNDVDFMVLTKRPEIAVMWLDNWLSINMNVPKNILIGTSIENDARAKERLTSMKTIHKMGFIEVSYEPALEAVDWLGWEFLNWLGCGGESGNGARPMPPAAARSAREFCQLWDIPFFFKQWGEWTPIKDLNIGAGTTFKHKPVRIGDDVMCQVGRGMAGHLLDGVEWRQLPGQTPIPTFPQIDKEHVNLGEGETEER
jgi:protein gp37